MAEVAAQDVIWKHHYDHPVPWDAEIPVQTMPQMFAKSVAQFADASMLDFMGRKFTYAECGEAAHRFATGLQKIGIKKGDRIGLYLPNVPHYVAAYYGALIAGATVVNFSPLYTVEELRHQVEDSGTTILVTLSAKALFPNALEVLNASSLERLIVGSVAGALPSGKSVLYRLFKRSESADVPVDERILPFSDLLDNDGVMAEPPIYAHHDVALIQYTGGTTGTPKGARLSHRNLTANAWQVNALDPWHDQADRILGVLPFFHVFANTCVLNRTIMNGGEIVMLPRFEAGQALQAINRTKPTSMPGVPTMYQALLDHKSVGKTDWSSLRVCISGGAPLPPELKEKFGAVTGANLVEGFGLTESAGVVSSNPFDGAGKPGTIGQPIPNTIVRLVGRDDPNVDAAPGQEGEIVVKGPQIMAGYWNRPDADGSSFINGWLRTGDIGIIDDEGYIRIVDRLKDMIAFGGFKVYPSVIEAQMRENPAIKEALALGVPDPYHGEVPRIYVTLEPDADGKMPDVTAQSLTQWLNARVGKHERVDRVEIRDTLPKTMIGKLDRKALRAEVEAQQVA